MDYLSLSHFDAAFEAVRPAFASPDSPSGVDARWPVVRSSLSLPTLEYCIRSYLTSEMDATTPGDRGLGRVSLHPPRLGGHFRSQIASLQVSEQWELYFAMLHLLLSAYVGYALLVEDPPRRPVVTAPETLFQKWIPLVYSSGGRPPQNVLDALMDVTSASAESTIVLLTRWGIDARNLPGNLMLFHYMIAGLDLRGVEVGYAG